jgi:transposase
MTWKPRLLLNDRQWTRIALHLRGRREDRGVTGRNNRRFVEAVLWALRTGAPWRDLPGYFGRWNTVYRRFRRWSLGGVWQRLHAALEGNVIRRKQAMALDSTVVRVHQHASGGQGGAAQQAIGISRGGRTSKVHLALGWHGAMLGCRLTGGQAADITVAPGLLAEAGAVSHVIADRAYDSDAFVAAIARRDALAVIPSRRSRRTPRPWDRAWYRERNRIERHFARLKHMRRLATRYDKTSPSYLAALHLAQIAARQRWLLRTA